MTEPEKELKALRERLGGILFTVHLNAVAKLKESGGDKVRFFELAGQSLASLSDSADELHEAYAAFARAQVKAAKEKK